MCRNVIISTLLNKIVFFRFERPSRHMTALRLASYIPTQYTHARKYRHTRAHTHKQRHIHTHTHTHTHIGHTHHDILRESTLTETEELFIPNEICEIDAHCASGRSIGLKEEIRKVHGKDTTRTRTHTHT